MEAVIVVTSTQGNTFVCRSYTTAHLAMERMLDGRTVTDISGFACPEMSSPEEQMLKEWPSHRIYFFKDEFGALSNVCIACRLIHD